MTTTTRDWRDELLGSGFVARRGLCLDVPGFFRVAGEVAELSDGLKVGPFNEVREVPGSPYRTQTASPVAPHNDGLFLPHRPRFIILYCVSPADDGGETFIVRGAAAAAALAADLRDFFASTPVEICLAETCATHRLLDEHPREAGPVFLFTDPSVSDRCTLRVGGVPLGPAVIARVRDALGRVDVAHTQRWAAGDLLVVDNLRFLHGRQAYTGRRVLWRALVVPSAADGTAERPLPDPH
jgi:gamma-butyrobetaine dioxygenase